MTFTKIVKNIFSKKSKDPEDNSNKKRSKAFFSRLSGAFMLPISVMAIAGLFLGVGAAIDSHTSAKTLGGFIKALGDPVFASMPALFCVAIIIAFTDEAGVAVFAGIVAFVVFSAIQTPFIDATSSSSMKNQLDPNYVLSHEMAAKYGIKFLAGTDRVDPTSAFTGLTKVVETGNWNGFTLYEDGKGDIIFAIASKDINDFGGYNFETGEMVNPLFDKHLFDLFGKPSDNTGFAKFLGINTPDSIASRMFKIAGLNWGISSLNTSIFGGICVGALVAYLYNQFHVIQLPSAIAFFGGKRFVALVSIIMVIPLAFLFLLVWPWIGLGLAYFGEYSGKVPGVDSLIFGFVERSLIPFGLHHVFYAPLWWTSAGGDVVTQLSKWGDATHYISAIDGQHFATTGNAGVDALINDISNSNGGNYMGDSFGWLALNGTGIKDITYTTDGGAHKYTAKLFDFISKEAGINFGRFMQGKFSFMQLGLPAAGAAMIFAAPKEKRKEAFSVVFAASLTSFITGVTEPIEFTFLFLAPWLFWGFHASMAALSFLFMNLLGAHVGMTFSGGFIDMIIYGALPISQGTHFYWMYVIGVVYAPIYFFVFYWAIKKFDLATPGRGGTTKLFTKADYKASKTSLGGTLNMQSAQIVKAVGGWGNIKSFANCATRLRYDIDNIEQVDDNALKAAGAAGVVHVGDKHVQIIMGPAAEQINTNIKSNIGVDIDFKEEQVSSETPKTETTKLAKPVNVKSVASGTVATLASLKDGVFSEKMMGDGLVVKLSKTAKKAAIYAPVSGELVTVFSTGHAYGIKTEDNVEVIIHIGLDTVNLQGKGFTPAVKQGEKITAGEKLADVDLAMIRDEVPSVNPIIVITSGQKVTKKATGKVTKTSKLFTVA